MCLAIPMQLVELAAPAADGAQLGMVEFGGLRRQVRLDLLDQAQIGDQLLVHAGFAIQIIDPEEAERLVGLLEELIAAEPADDRP